MKTLRKMNKGELFEILEEALDKYNVPNFIPSDPIQLPHRFEKLQDIEIVGLWTAVLSWGNRKSIIKSGERLIELMGGEPHDFVLNHSVKERKGFEAFVHRTFNGADALYFLDFFRAYYKKHESLEQAFSGFDSLRQGMNAFHNLFFSMPSYAARTTKHIAAPEKKSACKRINMFLRWMVRDDKRGVDFGLWKNLKPSQLYCPLDVHVDRIARELGLLSRKQRDWLAVEELTNRLKRFDPEDPVKYDFALFGISIDQKTNG